jgi:carbon monoxide dehydrogenase subunit G
MQLEQRFTLAHAPTVVWPQFHDIPALVQCLPGASLTGPMEGATVPLRFDVKLGPIAAGFVGTGTVTFDESAGSGVFEGSATDRRTNSRVKGAANFQVLPAPSGGSEIVVTVDYALTGTLAQFGRAGIVRELAAALTAQFARRLEAQLSQSSPRAEGQAEAQAAASGAEGDAGVVSGAAVKPLSLFGLLADVLRRQWARLRRRAA